MTEQQARTAANLVMAAAAAGAALLILRRPPLRRLAAQLARSWIKGPILVWAVGELRQAWNESGSHLASERAALTVPAPRR